MFKKIINYFKVSKTLRLARIVLLVAIVAAIVVTAIGLVQIVDVTEMKELLGMAKNQKLIANDVMVYLLQHYLIWALLILAAGCAGHYALKVKDRKEQAA